MTSEQNELSVTKEIFDIFYDEARKITRNDDEARALKDQAVSYFLEYYPLSKAG